MLDVPLKCISRQNKKKRSFFKLSVDQTQLNVIPEDIFCVCVYLTSSDAKKNEQLRLLNRTDNEISIPIYVVICSYWLILRR